MRKFLVSMLMVVALFAMSGMAMAQTEVICGTLSAADCDVLVKSAEAQAGLNSATFDFNLSISVDGQAVPLTGTGSYAIDPAVIASFDADALATADPSAILEVLGGALGSFSGELNINAMGMIDLNLLLLNGTGYLNFAGIAPLLGGPQALSSMGLPTGWAGLDLVGAIEMFGPMLGSMDTSALPSTTDTPSQEEILSIVSTATSITRGADEAGQAVFVTTLNFAELFQNQAFLDMIIAQAGSDIPEGALEQIQPMLQAAGNGFTFTATQKIDLTSSYLTSISFAFALDGATLSQVAGQEIGNIGLTGALNFANFNSAPALSAPAGAPIATVMDLMGLFGAMGGGF